MRKNRGRHGFGIVESLISLFVVGIILGVVAKGYQALNRLQLASYDMSIRIELISFLQRLTYEASSALSLTTAATSFQFQRINPTLNNQRDQAPPARLPWPLPIPPSTTGVLTGPALITTSYSFNAAATEVSRTAFGQTIVVARDVGEFTCGTEAVGKILWVQCRPKNMTAAVKAKVLLPVVP